MSKKSVSVRKNLEKLVNSLNEERNTKMDTFFEVEEEAQPKPQKKKFPLIEILLSNIVQIGLSINKVELSLLKISKQNDQKFIILIMYLFVFMFTICELFI